MPTVSRWLSRVSSPRTYSFQLAISCCRFRPPGRQLQPGTPHSNPRPFRLVLHPTLGILCVYIFPDIPLSTFLNSPTEWCCFWLCRSSHFDAIKCQPTWLDAIIHRQPLQQCGIGTHQYRGSYCSLWSVRRPRLERRYSLRLAIHLHSFQR